MSSEEVRYWSHAPRATIRVKLETNFASPSRFAVEKQVETK